MESFKVFRPNPMSGKGSRVERDLDLIELGRLAHRLRKAGRYKEAEENTERPWIIMARSLRWILRIPMRCMERRIASGVSSDTHLP